MSTVVKSAVVDVRNLTKTYGDVIAVDHLSFSLTADTIYGLLGRNGSGKTTIMRILAAQEFATSGDVKVFGAAPYENGRVLSQLCLVKDTQTYPKYFRVSDVLDVALMFFPQWDREYAFALADAFRLPLNRRMRALSRGMLSAAGIVVGLASRAPLTMFDEPYLGLDAVARSLFYDRLLDDYAEHPRTIILSTHLIDEVSRLLEHVLVMDEGRLILDEEADALRGRAFTVVGPAAKVEAFTAGKDVIARQPLGSLVSATVMGHQSTGGNGSASDRKRAEALGLDVVPVSLQRLIVHLTDGQSERKAVEVQ